MEKTTLAQRLIQFLPDGRLTVTAIDIGNLAKTLNQRVERAVLIIGICLIELDRSLVVHFAEELVHKA